MSDHRSGAPEGASEDDEMAAGRGGNVTSPESLVQLSGAPEEVWTPEAMEAATPCNVIEVDEVDIAEAMREADGADAPEAGGADMDGAPPAEDADAQDGPDLQATRGGYDYPGPFTRDEVPGPYTAYPHRTVGKLFFKRGGGSFVCSASVIGGDAIWSAGHCLHAGNNRADGWARDVVFAPAYKDGNAPLGLWKAKSLTVRTAWYKHGNPKGLYEDMGGAVLFPLNGRRISAVCGYLGFASGWSRYQHWRQLGYPAAAPFDGRRMVEVASSFAYQGNVPGSPDPNATGNDMTGGSSGGPWVIDFGSRNRLNGNNSYRLSSRPKEMNSPYFGKSASSLYKQLRAAKA